MEETNQQKAVEIWETLNESERRLVSFGMFPADKMPQELNKDDNHEIVVALMEMAKNERIVS